MHTPWSPQKSIKNATRLSHFHELLSSAFIKACVKDSQSYLAIYLRYLSIWTTSDLDFSKKQTLRISFRTKALGEENSPGMRAANESLYPQMESKVAIILSREPLSA